MAIRDRRGGASQLPGELAWASPGQALTWPGLRAFFQVATGKQGRARSFLSLSQALTTLLGPGLPGFGWPPLPWPRAAACLATCAAA